VVVGIYPMRIARFVLDQVSATNGHASTNGQGNGFHPPQEPVRQPSASLSGAEDGTAE